ncbi:L,D-transpeptidase family protein [Olsenella sp. An285]|uniref:L,D-transpeptidase family protein n=1 Tax=Olsenella sp. An285 TaxID=1965621 RepID=UPI0013024820|nr:L,D-transpeptidase [Olsenella sp. An285]
MKSSRNRRPLAVTAGLACALGIAAALTGVPVVSLAEGSAQAAALASETPVSEGHWLVTGEYTGGVLQRYWINPDGSIARGKLLHVVEGTSDYYAYATPDGPVVRGRWVDPSTGYIYFANNDGRLESAGWVVTGAYTNGALQRYWIDEDVHAAIPGYSSDGWDHYTMDEGYVARGAWTDPSTGYVYLANNDGLLAGTGWVVADSYGHGLQRYWVDPDSHACEPGFSDEGWAHYTTDAGYVLRGSVRTEHGLLIANNDGLLAEGVCSEGFSTTSALNGRETLYYFKRVNGHLYAQTGFFEASGAWRYAGDDGSVLRGKLSTSNGVLLADGSGRLADSLAQSEGMLVTDAFDGVLQRYYLVRAEDGHLYARTGLFEFDGDLYFGLSDQGYLARNCTITAEGGRYEADNDAKLTLVHAIAQRVPDATIGTVTWGNDHDYLNALVRLAEREGSKTDWFVTFDNELFRVVVLHRGDGGWQVEKTWNCVGATATYSGKWEVLHKRESNWYSETYDWFQNGNGPNAWSTDYIWGIRSEWSQNHERWVDSPYGSGYEDCAAIHGTGWAADHAPGKGNRGCCGLLNANAKWVYDNVDIGSTVYEFEYSQVNFF